MPATLNIALPVNVPPPNGSPGGPDGPLGPTGPVDDVQVNPLPDHCKYVAATVGATTNPVSLAPT